jgi:TonB family protein
MQFITLGYWIVVMVLIAKLIIEIAGIARIYQNGEKETYNGRYIIVHKEVTAPFSFFNAVFLSPEIRTDHAKFNKIYKHEATHIQLKHSLDAVLIEILCAVFWINPLVYIYKKALKAIHEYQADNVVEETDLIEYTQLLLAQSQSGLQLALTNQFFQSQLKSRIIMMMKQRSNETNKWKYLFAIPVIAISILLFSFKNSDSPKIDEIIQGVRIEKSNGMLDSFPKSKDGAFMTAEDMPLFPGCEDIDEAEAKRNCAMAKLMKFITENVEYPAAAKKKGIEGFVVVQFNVNEKGEVVDIFIARGIGGGCDEEAIRVVEKLNNLGSKWTPGYIDGNAVKVKMTLPIRFKLSSEEMKTAKTDDANPESYDKTQKAMLNGNMGTQQDPGKGEIYKVVEEMPLFPGADDMTSSTQKIVEYIVANLKYPEKARADNLEGRVVVTFVVEPNGAISTIRVPKGLSLECDAEVIRVIESMNNMKSKWTPGTQKGEKVRVQFALPVAFKL